MIAELLAKVETEWRADLEQEGVTIRPPLSAMKIGDLDSMNRKFNLLIFDQHEKYPVLVLRVAHTEEQRALLINECVVLGDLTRRAALSDSMPRLLGIYEHQNLLIAAEQGCAGISLLALMFRHQHTSPVWVRRDFRLVCDTLHKFERATLDGTLPFPNPEQVREKIVQIVSHYRSIEWPKGCLERLVKIADENREMNLPGFSRHGDFWAGNLLLSPHGLRVIDWEGYSQHDGLFHDIFFFMTNYAMFYPWHGWKKCSDETAFKNGFLENNWLALLIKDTIRAFFYKWNIQPRAVYLLLVLFLMEMSLPASIRNDPRYPPQYDKWFNLFQTFIHGKPLLLEPEPISI